MLSLVLKAICSLCRTLLSASCQTDPLLKLVRHSVSYSFSASKQHGIFHSIDLCSSWILFLTLVASMFFCFVVGVIEKLILACVCVCVCVCVYVCMRAFVRVYMYTPTCRTRTRYTRHPLFTGNPCCRPWQYGMEEAGSRLSCWRTPRKLDTLVIVQRYFIY